MTKAMLTLILLVALPAASEKAKQPTLEGTRVMIRNLEETVEEQQERLRIHKTQIDTLQKTVSALESRLSSLEKSRPLQKN
jgi:septal ring factor EnvC (AmiA/AmiB activator)